MNLLSFNMIGIYKITSPIGRVYIGQSINIKRRFYDYKLKRCKSQTKLYNSFNKHGVDNHKLEIIEECSIDRLNERERYWQEYYDSINKYTGLNCLLTSCDNKRMILSNETKSKISRTLKGRKQSLSHIENARKGRIGIKKSEETKNKIRISNTGKKRSDQFKEKMRIINTGKKQSKYTIEKRFKNSYGANHHSAILIININTGIFYDTIKEASKSVTHISYKNISRQLKGNRNMINNPFSYC